MFLCLCVRVRVYVCWWLYVCVGVCARVHMSVCGYMMVCGQVGDHVGLYVEVVCKRKYVCVKMYLCVLLLCVFVCSRVQSMCYCM